MAANPDALDLRERVRALVECPQPLLSLLSGKFADADPALRKQMLEALTLRYYRIRKLTNFRSLTIGGHCYASAEYDLEGKHIHFFTTHAQFSQLADVARTMFSMIAGVPAEHDVLLDFYVFHPGRLDDPEAAQQEVCSVLNEVGFPRLMRRIVVSVAGRGQGNGASGAQHFTYRPTKHLRGGKAFPGNSPHDGQTPPSLAAG
jgi:hypothetical protein